MRRRRTYLAARWGPNVAAVGLCLAVVAYLFLSAAVA